jgi:hypothetical protein
METGQKQKNLSELLRERYQRLGLKKGEIDPETGEYVGIIHKLRLPKGQRLPDLENGKPVPGTGTYVPEDDPMNQ